MRTYFTSESVTEGHPDKLCDRVSDAILDEILSQDSKARVACETFATTGIVQVMGEITTTAQVDYQRIVRDCVREIGYNSDEACFHADTIAVLTSIHQQSPDIAGGVDNAVETRNSQQEAATGAGDQGMMFGYACTETEELMPLPIMLAQKLAYRLAEVRKENIVPNLLPDGKAQVTVIYEDGVPVAVDTVVISTQHRACADYSELCPAIEREVIRKVIPAAMWTEQTKLYINPSGRFVLGGPAGDTGLTGRKIIVDTYGGYAPHGGGAFSGKDPSKVDRSAAYAARYVAKNIVAAGLAERCQVAVSYAIGVAKPISIQVSTFGTGKIDDERLSTEMVKVFDLSPDGIEKMLHLRRPLYKQVSAYGHFGRENLNLPWEQTDRVNELKALFA